MEYFSAGKCAIQFKNDSLFLDYQEQLRPALINLLTTSKSYENRARCIELAYDLKLGQDIKEALLQGLDSPNWLVREGAVRILGDLKLKEVEHEVRNHATDGVMWVRASAIWALGEIGLDSSEPTILNAVNDEYDFVSRWATSALRRLHRVQDDVTERGEWLDVFWREKLLGELRS